MPRDKPRVTLHFRRKIWRKYLDLFHHHPDFLPCWLPVKLKCHVNRSTRFALKHLPSCSLANLCKRAKLINKNNESGFILCKMY